MLTFEFSLAVPNGIYVGLVLLVGLNFFIGREFSYKIAFALGLVMDLVHVHLLFLSSALVLLVLVKLAELFVERVYNSESELRTYLVTMVLVTLIVTLPSVLMNFGWPALWIVAQCLLVNIVSVLILLFIFRKFKEIYYINV